MKTKLIASVIAVAALIGASVYFANRTASVEQADSGDTTAIRVSVRMKWFFAGTMTGWFAGKQQGIFERHGIDLTINPGGPDNNSVKLVAAGSDMFGVAGADEVLLARAKGVPVVAIGVLFKESPICFISKQGLGITTPAGWSGKTVEVSYGSNAEVQYRALVAKFNVQNIREVPYTFNLVPFIEDKVDVSVAYRMDQVVTLERRGIDLNIITPKEYGINPYGDVVITTEDTLRDHPDLVRRFMAAVIESHQWAVENPDRAVAGLIATAGDLKFDNERAVWAATIPFLTAEGGSSVICQMRAERWQETMSLLTDFQFLKDPIKLSASWENVTTEF